MRAPRTTTATAAVAALTAGLLASAGAPPAGAQEQPGGGDHPMPVAGDFVGDEAQEMFVYWPGPAGPDQLVSFARDGAGNVSTQKQPFPVNGVYEPVAGDFDGDGKDELLWYGFRTAPDYLWDFTGAGGVSSTPLTINGPYVPLAGDFTGDGADDVLWYGVGGWADHIWEHDPGGARNDVPTNVGGYYQPVVGSFGGDETDDILWYAYVPEEDDYLWDFRPGAAPDPESSPLPISGHYQPLALDMYAHGPGGHDIIWYGIGTDPDHVWNFFGGTLHRGSAAVNGYYFPVVAGDFLGDGADDVLWFVDQYPNLSRSINVWDHTMDGGTLVRTTYQLGPDAWLSAG